MNGEFDKITTAKWFC